MPKVKLSEVQCAVMDELRGGAQTVSELSRATERRVTWMTMTRLRDLGLVNLHPRDRTWYLTGNWAAASASEEPKA